MVLKIAIVFFLVTGIFWLVEIINMRKRRKIDITFWKPVVDLKDIVAKDVEMYNTIIELEHYLTTTYNDKYQAEDPEISGEEIIYDDTYGKGFNTGNALKYIKRYRTKGFLKSENPQDLLKAAHYLLIEITRLKK